MTDTRATPNYTGALLSFLRVLATNVGTALLPLFLSSAGNAEEYPAGKAMTIAVVVSALLTVVNYFRAGETRFGPPPNPDAPREVGAGTLGTIGLVLILLAVVLLVCKLLALLFVPALALVLLAGLGLALILVDGSARA